MTSGGAQGSITTTTHLQSFRAKLFAKTCRFMPWNFFHSLDMIYELILLPRVYIYSRARARAHTRFVSRSSYKVKGQVQTAKHMSKLLGDWCLFIEKRGSFFEPIFDEEPPVRVDVKRYSKNFNRPCARRKIIISRKNGFKTQTKMYKKIWRNKW